MIPTLPHLSFRTDQDLPKQCAASSHSCKVVWEGALVAWLHFQYTTTCLLLPVLDALSQLKLNHGGLALELGEGRNVHLHKVSQSVGGALVNSVNLFQEHLQLLDATTGLIGSLPALETRRASCQRPVAQCQCGYDCATYPRTR